MSSRPHGATATFHHKTNSCISNPGHVVLPSYMKPSKRIHDTGSVGTIPTCCFGAGKVNGREVRSERKKKRTRVLHNLNLLKRKKERGRHKQFNFIEQYIDFESQWGSWQTAENAIFHYRDPTLFTDANERETS